MLVENSFPECPNEISQINVDPNFDRDNIFAHASPEVSSRVLKTLQKENAEKYRVKYFAKTK